MFSVFDYYMQAIATSEGLVERWASYIADPFAEKGMPGAHVTQFAPSPVAIFFGTKSGSKMGQKRAFPKLILDHLGCSNKCF